LSFLSGTSGTAGTAGTQATANLGITGANAAGGALSGSIVLSNGNGNVTFTMNASPASVAISGGSSIYLAAANSNLTGLAAAMDTALGVTTNVSSSGVSIAINF
jgi:L-lactate utilization protein LutB